MPGGLGRLATCEPLAVPMPKGGPLAASMLAHRSKAGIREEGGRDESPTSVQIEPFAYWAVRLCSSPCLHLRQRKRCALTMRPSAIAVPASMETTARHLS